MTMLRPAAIAATLFLTCVVSPAVARQQATPTPSTAITPGARADDAFAAAVPDTDLRRATGRGDIGAIVASATQRNTVANNSVIGTSTTGSIRIDGNAFQNVQGLAVVSANSGNNVAMNAAMNVTVNMPSR